VEWIFPLFLWKRVSAPQGRPALFLTPLKAAALTAFCRQHGVELVAMEATGGYKTRAFALPWAHGLPVALLNPRAVRRFAEAMGLLEKTDRIDARVIAWFAAAGAPFASLFAVLQGTLGGYHFRNSSESSKTGVAYPCRVEFCKGGLLGLLCRQDCAATMDEVICISSPLVAITAGRC
jgi:hypothetical protein